MTAKEAILVDDIADLEPNEIHRFASNSSTGPFSCFPLVTPDSRTIGVLSVDSCRKAHRLLPQSMSVEALSAFLLRMQLQDAALELKKVKMDGAHFLALTEVELRHKPTFQRLKVITRQKLLELVRALQRGSRIHLPDGNRAIPFTQDDDAVEFLDGVSKLAGPFLTNYRRVHWIQDIANVTRNAKCTAYDVYDVLIRAVTQSMEPLERVSVWKIAKNARTPTQWEVDVVASTSVPDDRLVPFLDGQERKMKRISLYKENEEAVRSSLDSGRNTPLIRGGIINITTEPENSATVPFCENAKYQISWADRTLQAVSWPQLRQFLPIRNMNAKHFQLRQLCSQLEANEKVFKVTSPNGIVLVLRDSSRPESVKYALQVDFTTQFEPPQEQQNFLDRAVSAAEQAIACVRGREARHAFRKHVVAKNTHKFQSIGLNPSGDALRALHDIIHQVFQDIVEILPGVHVQIAELQADGVQLKYTFASKNSTALGCSLSRGQGVSFMCLDTKIPIVVNATSEFKSRLQRIGGFRNQPQSVDAAFPFLFLPLFHEDCCVGVLSVDSFQSVPKGREDETHPEAGVLEFLIPLAKLLASAIYAKRRSFALYELLLNCQKPLRSPQQLLFYACRALKDVVIGAWKVRVVEIDGFKGKTTLVYDFSEAERELAQSWTVCVVRPMAFHWKELCTDTIMTHLRQLQPGEEPSADSVIKLIAAIREDEKERQQTMERFQELIAQEKKKPAVEAEKTKLLEKQIADKYFFLLPDEGQVVNDRITSEKYITHALKQFLGATTCLYSDIHAMARLSSKLFLTITALPPFYAKCDQIYLHRVTSITSKYFTALQGRVRRSSDRVAALIEFRDLCQKVLINDEISPIVAVGGRYRHKLLLSKEIEKECLLELQRDAIALIERVLKFPNVYFGMWEPALRILRYTSASKYSRMAGKKLKHGHGVSFPSMEKQVPIVITTRDADDDEVDSSFMKLRYFTNELPVDRKWPFIVVPVGNIGVLALDNMHTYEEDSHELQPELGVVDFLRKIGQSFAEVITVIRERTALQRQQLRDEAIVRVMSACENFKPTSNTPGTVSTYLLHLVLQQVENAFNGVDAYIGLADPLCERIRFICASSRSKMEKKTVNTTQSLSFRVFASQRTIVIPQLSQYFKEQKLLQQRDSEHGQKLKYFGELNPPQGPFVCVPIPFVGILSVDTFPGAAGGVFSTGFPEDGVVALLEKAANYLGENIRTLAATDARKLLPTLFRGTRTSFKVLFHEILHIISRNLLATIELQALRYTCNSSGKWIKQEPLASMKRSTNETQHDGDEELYLTQCIEIQLGRNLEIPNQLSVQQLVKYPEIQIVYCSPTCDVKDDTAALLPTILVLRRVKGAVWEYDKDFLLSILPLINSLIALVNIRVQGIVGRRLAIRKIDELCSSLGSYSSSEALEMMYSETLPTAMDTIAQAMSLDNCDAYLGQRERTDKAVSHLQLRFVAASSRSLMSGVALDLENIENLQLQVVQCLQNQQIVTVILSRDNSLVRALTTKPAQRIFLAVPMGDNCVLCADSLGQEAFIPGKNQIEPDIILFFKAAASKLHETILSTRHRFSYDQLMSLSLRSHTDFRLFHWTILEGLRRDLVNFHSQQILTLGTDFTSAFRLEAWQRSSTRRPLKTLPGHFCSVTGCERMKITHEIHSEDEIYLPMTNLPRTLDLCRSRMQPMEGTEKHGSFTCACMATMLDSSVKDAKLALCVFSHDAKARDAREMPTSRQSMIPRDYGDSTVFFSNYQRQYFFAFAAVASTVYTHVFRACALETFATELFVTLQEYLDAKEGLVVRFSPSSTESMGLMETAILFSQQPGKSPPGRAVQGKLEKKIRQFEESEAPVAIFMTKKALVAPPSADFKVRSKAKASEEKPAKCKERFFQFKGKKLFRFGKKKKQDEEEKQAREQQQLLEAVPELQALSPSRAQQLRHERISLNIFVRGLDFQDRHDMVYFTVEKQSLAAATSVEKLIHQVKARAEALATEIQSKTPQGNEEINAKRFCSQSKRGGGGFLVLSLLEKAREGFQLVEGTLGGAMRQFLTGAQSTARDNKSENLSSLFSEDSTLTPTIALLRVTLVACAVKRGTVLALSQDDLFKEYLRLQAGRKLLQLEPTDKKTWGAIGRARTLLRNFNEAIHTLDPRLEEGNEPVGVKAEANQALYALLDLLLTQSAVVRYLNQLEAEISRERKRFYDDPAIVLQCFVRQTQARMELKKRRAEFHAALAIQCAFRQHLARRRLLFMKWNQAAITVQRAYRRKRQRAKGTKPRRFTVQLLSASQSISKSPSVVGTDSLDGAWKTDMAAFGTFQEYLGSKMGREQLKKEEELMWKHRQELEKERAKLPRAEALREDVGDLFELLDDSGSGELSRERTANLITRLHVPLNDEEVADVVAMMDNDGSGAISMDEFMRWFVHEFPVLQKRAPKVCGVVTRKDWQWVIQQSARSATLKRWRALRAGNIATAPGGASIATKVQDSIILEEEHESEEI
ncbi:putative calcium-binding protein CML17 [Phytophthora citrophthora]|uniref:Calcium-binding protein CML17 n=1 Tax=Phytophthora citrophthora TaxID=4793 RepID=A0AAD9G9B3_9STRA|nr:putative calcium-binding protein CML17 [Phytophthora citrophthora]